MGEPRLQWRISLSHQFSPSRFAPVITTASRIDSSPQKKCRQAWQAWQARLRAVKPESINYTTGFALIQAFRQES